MNEQQAFRDASLCEPQIVVNAIVAILQQNLLVPVWELASPGRFTEAQKRQILATLKSMPEDSFDWAAAWELEELFIEEFLNELRASKDPRTTYQASMEEAMPEGLEIPSPKELSKFREYMAGAMAALKLSPDAAKSTLEMLGTQKQALNEFIRHLIPSPQKVNESRAEVVSVRKGLIIALGSK